MASFALELKKTRKRLKMSQQEVCDKSGIALDTLRKIEGGKVVPRYDTIVLMSSLYRIDIIELFARHATIGVLFKYYEKVNAYIIERNIDGIKETVTELEEIKNDPKVLNNVVNITEFHQLFCFFRGIQLYYADAEKHAETVSAMVSESLSLRHDGFTYENISRFRYTYIELRLLLLASLSTAETNISLSTEILLHLQNQTTFFDSKESSFHLKVKILLNLSYNHYLMEDDKKAMKYAELGIKLAKDKRSAYLLSDLYLRFGVAKYYLHHDDYKTYLFYSHQLNMMYGEESLADKLVIDLRKVHNIDLDLHSI